jgi:cysteine desulfurase
VIVDSQIRAYLDHAATTPISTAAREAMRPWLDDQFGNPSGGHAESRLARRTVDDARDHIAELFGADLGDVVFTGSGTEADNLAVLGSWPGRENSGSQLTALVCSAMEHHAVLASCRALATRHDLELREIPTSKDGLIDREALAAACTPEVGLVSVMTVNNEIGTIQPLAEVADIAREGSPHAVLHTDAVQAVKWLDVQELTGPYDLLAVSGHKIGGPQGTGALIVRKDVHLQPIIHGGGQERGRRSGTQNVAGIVGLAAAMSETFATRSATVARVGLLRDRLGDGLLAQVTGAVETGERRDRVAGTLHLRFGGIESEALVLLLDEAGIAVSAGAACSSGAVEPSHVLQSMGLGSEEAGSGIRFSLGAASTDADIDLALVVVPAVIDRLRD